MNTSLFLDMCQEVLPPGKPLTSTQMAAYRDKLQSFSGDQLQRLYDSILENCKFFPKIADVYEQAKLLGFVTRREEKPHTWTPTDCKLCGGSGLVAGFWSQEFEFGNGVKAQVLRMRYLFPYHESASYAAQKDHDDIRSVYRCNCERGAVETIGKGIPRWREDMPSTIRRSWGI